MDDPLAGIERAARILAGADDPDILHVADALAAFVGGRAGSLDEAFRLPRRRPGERTPATEMAISARNGCLREIAEHYYPDRPTAVQAQEIARDLGRYASTAWVRERVLEECPARHHGTARELFWRVLMLRDHVLSERTARSVLVAN